MLSGFILNIDHTLLHEDHIISRVGISAAVYCVVRPVGNKRLSGQFPYTGFTILAFAVFINGFAFPEREQFFSHDFLVFIRDIERILRTASDGIDFVYHPSPCDIRRKCSCTWCAIWCSDDQFIILDHQRRCFTAVTEAFCTKFDFRHTRVFFCDFCYRTCSVSRNGRNLLQEILFKSYKTFCRTYRNSIFVNLRSRRSDGRIVSRMLMTPCRSRCRLSLCRCYS